MEAVWFAGSEPEGHWGAEQSPCPVEDPGYRVDLVWHWSRETTQALGLSEHLRVHAARPHWAVHALRAGPGRLVQTQLGHATPTLTIGRPPALKAAKAALRAPGDERPSR